VSAAELLALAATQGVTARLVGDTVKLRPADHVTPELLVSLRAHRDEIREHLRRQPAPGYTAAAYQRREAAAIGTARPPERHRRCPSCDAGLQPNDDDRAPCFTCRAPSPWWVNLARMRVM
jgi:hypothetical protein